jgi:hypothetical protein
MFSFEYVIFDKNGESIVFLLFVKNIKPLSNKKSDLKEKFTQSHARIGQGKYREKLLKQCPICPITLVSDDQLRNYSVIRYV